MTSAEQARKSYRKRLGALAARRRSRSLIGAASIFICLVAGAWLVCAAALALAGSRPALYPVVFTLFWAVAAAASAAAVRAAAIPAAAPGELAWLLGMRSGSGSLLASAWEFARGGARLAPFSGFLVGRTIEDARQVLESTDTEPVLRAAGRPHWTAAALVAACAVLLQLNAAPGETRLFLSAISDPGLFLRQRPMNTLVAAPAVSPVLEGAGAEVRAARAGARRDPVRVAWSSVEGIWQSGAPAADTVLAAGTALEVFSWNFTELRDDVVYRFESGAERTPLDTIRVTRRPVINHIGAVIEPPAYLGLRPDTLPAVAGRISAPAGAVVTLRGLTSTEIGAGELRFASGRRVPLEPQRGGFRGSFDLARDDTLTILIADGSGLENENPPAYALVALEDRPPLIEIIAPEDGAAVPRSQRISVVFRAYDDHGIERIALYFMRERRDQAYTRVPVEAPRGAARIEGPFEWSLQDVRLLPGDRVLYYLEAVDGNTVDGPGTGRTGARTLVVPTLAELYAETRERGERQRDGMDEILAEGRRIRERLGDLSREIRAEGGMDWSRRSEADGLLEQQQQLREQIRAAAERLDETLENLEQNRAVSMEIGERMEEIRDLLQRIESQQVREAIEKLQRMLRELPDEEVAAAMQEIELSAEDLVRRLDRAIELLQRLLEKQAVEEMMRRMEEMVERQRDLRDSTLAGVDEAVAERQDLLGDEFESFARDLDGLSERSGESGTPELGEAAQAAAGGGIDSLMRAAAGDIRRGEREGAVCSQNEALGRMLSLYTRLGSCQQAMSAAADLETSAAVERLIVQLIEVSRQQERFAGGLPAYGGSAEVERLIEDQLVMREAARRITGDLYEVARQSMSISEAAMLHLGIAAAAMEEAMRELDSRRTQQAAQAAAAAPKHLNLAAIELLRAVSSGGGGAGGAGEGMQLMLESQMEIDSRLRELFGSAGGQGPSMAERAAMARLAAEQRRMDELLQRVLEESGGSGAGLGDISDLGSEMRELAGMLDEGRLDAEVMQRQERILSRLLESQRSLTRRDYSRRRTGRAAERTWGEDPGAGPRGADGRQELLEMIRRAMRERGPAEFEELNRLYFRALSGKARQQ